MSAVVLGSLFQIIDLGFPLLGQAVDIGLVSVYSPVEEQSDASTNAIDEQRRAYQSSIVIDGPILRPEDEDDDEQEDEVGEGGVQRPEGVCSATSAAGCVEAQVCGRDLRGEFGQGLFKRRRRGVISLERSVSGMLSWYRVVGYLPSIATTCLLAAWVKIAWS